MEQDHDPRLAAGGAGAEERAPSRPKPRWSRILLAVVAVLLVAAVATVVIGFSPFVRWLTLREAARLGVELELGEVEVAWEAVTVRDFRFRLLGIRGLAGRAERLTIALDGLEPRSLDASGITLELEGSATDLGLALAGYAAAYPEIFALPAKADDVDLTWTPNPGGERWLAVRDATVNPSDHGGALAAKKVEVVGISVGKVGATWRGDEAEVVIGLGVDDLEDAPVRLLVEHALDEPRATFTLRPTPLERLAGPFAMALPIAGITASGKSVITFAGDGPDAPIEGTLQVQLDGYRPPVPPEVRGIVFGDDTAVTSRLEVSGDRKRVTLREIHVTHGAFELFGEGSAVREPSYAVVAMALTGKLACNQLAAAAANIRVGGEVGSWLGKLAGRSVTGTVAVTVSVRADTRNLSKAAVAQQIGVGCGLRPDKLLPKMPKLPGELPKLPKVELDLPKLPSLGRD